METKQQNALQENQQKDNLKKIIREVVTKEVTEQLKSSLFTSRKLTDTPTDSLQVTNRKYVTLNGASANRPVSSVVGQFYFDTTLGFPCWWDGSKFVDAAGNTV